MVLTGWKIYKNVRMGAFTGPCRSRGERDTNFQTIYFFIQFLNILNIKVNFCRRESVQLVADAQWSYYGTRT